MVLIAASGCDNLSRVRPAETAAVDWHNDWTLPRGYSLSRDASGFTLPTAIAFVPSPGTAPKDPLYFVTELHGAVKVVTNDRTVLTFADHFAKLDSVEAFGIFPSLELGMGGICLDPANGFVFVTFVYHDSQKVLRNNIARFETVPGTFSVTPTSSLLFTEIFAPYRSAVSHQIGQCQVRNGKLYVGVGDGQQPIESQSVGSPLGKILRMTVDGDPVPGNPLFTGLDRRNAKNYVWAFGLRNPFGLALVGERVFAADNGNNIDRIIEVKRGHNFLWDGTDRSIGTNAIAVLAPGRGLTHMDVVPDSSLAPRSDGSVRILQVVSGDSEQLATDSPPQILEIEYDSARSAVTSAPRAVLRYRGTTLQTLVGVAARLDGFYFVGMFPDRSDTTSVYRVTLAPGRENTSILEEERAPLALMRDYGCFGCHRLYGDGDGRRGPVLDRDLLMQRLDSRLNSAPYRVAIDALDTLANEPFLATRTARAAVANAAGRDKLRLWVEFHLREPRFDNPNALMPNLAVTADHAAAIAEFLVGRDSVPPGWNGPSEEQPASYLMLGLPTQVAVALAAFLIGALVGRMAGRPRRPKNTY